MGWVRFFLMCAHIPNSALLKWLMEILQDICKCWLWNNTCKKHTVLLSSDCCYCFSSHGLLKSCGGEGQAWAGRETVGSGEAFCFVWADSTKQAVSFWAETHISFEDKLLKANSLQKPAHCTTPNPGTLGVRMSICDMLGGILLPCDRLGSVIPPYDRLGDNVSPWLYSGLILQWIL